MGASYTENAPHDGPSGVGLGGHMLVELAGVLECSVSFFLKGLNVVTLREPLFQIVIGEEAAIVEGGFKKRRRRHKRGAVRQQ